MDVFCAVIVFLLDWLFVVDIVRSMKLNKNKIFWGFMVLLFVLMFAELGWRYYDKWHSQRRVAELAAELERLEQEDYAKKATDIIGGATPQETLEMFIEAVEAGDYELASKYFVLERQGEELKSLQNSLKENIDNMMGLLKQVDVSSEGYSSNQTGFIVHDPLFVSFILYPSGNWKIEKI